MNFKSQTNAENTEWKCEFCNFTNQVNLDDEEKPKTEAVTYLVEAAAQVVDKKMAG